MRAHAAGCVTPRTPLSLLIPRDRTGKPRCLASRTQSQQIGLAVAATPHRRLLAALGVPDAALWAAPRHPRPLPRLRRGHCRMQLVGVAVQQRCGPAQGAPHQYRRPHAPHQRQCGGDGGIRQVHDEDRSKVVATLWLQTGEVEVQRSRCARACAHPFGLRPPVPAVSLGRSTSAAKRGRRLGTLHRS